jgi:hypothetical protein
MIHDGTLNGLWIVRTGDGQVPLLARVRDELYVLVFTNALKATRCGVALGAEGKPFYVCGANIAGVVHELRAQGARAFIVDYDVERASFTSAHPLPRAAEAASSTR